jgi:hypothetical protein
MTASNYATFGQGGYLLQVENISTDSSQFVDADGNPVQTPPGSPQQSSELLAVRRSTPAPAGQNGKPGWVSQPRAIQLHTFV